MKYLIPLLRAECGLAFLMIFGMVPSAFGTNRCEPLGGEKEVTRGKPLVVGKPYVVPNLHLRFSDLQTGDPVMPKKVRVFYTWWAYMMQDGVWNTNNEIIDCYPKGGEFVIPSYEVRPRSWKRYRNSFLPWRKPSFFEAEVRVYADYMGQSIIIKRRNMKRFRGKTLHVKIPKPKSTSILFEYWLEEPDGSNSRVERRNGGPYSATSSLTPGIPEY